MQRLFALDMNEERGERVEKKTLYHMSITVVLSVGW